jgi:xanthine/uracil/vitamin C permease (AzgA family)
MTRAGFMKGDPEKAMTKVNRAMCVDGFGLWLGAIIGSNSITCYIESNTGIEAGARTGFASIVTGCAFLLSLLFIAPFVASACEQGAAWLLLRTRADASAAAAQSSRMRPPPAPLSWLACTASTASRTSTSTT